jgi:predicted nucleic acid-binding protein
VVYLDTGCLVKLYYPEPESAAVAAAVVGEPIAFTALHELEIVTAMQLKVFRGEARPQQVVAAIGLVREDLAAGKLMDWPTDWRSTFHEAVRVAQTHAAATGCRSLDTLHCALAKAVSASLFVSSDERQIKLARAAGLRVLAI